MQVSENGVISFGKPWKYSHPQLFPTDDYYIQQSFVIAPFWSDNDIRKEGTVRYTVVHPEDNNANGNNVGPFDMAKVIITNNANDADFSGTWMLVVQWDKVHPHPHGADDHEGISEEFLNKVCA